MGLNWIEIGREGVAWINLALDMDKWQAAEQLLAFQ
jgi:hypothetical protein